MSKCRARLVVEVPGKLVPKDLGGCELDVDGHQIHDRAIVGRSVWWKNIKGNGSEILDQKDRDHIERVLAGAKR